MPRVTLELLRYLVVTACGLIIDISVGVASRKILHQQLIVDAGLGFTIGLLFNYVLFEKWVFGHGQLSWTGLFRVFVAAQVALIVRLSGVWALNRLGRLSTLAVLLDAAVLSSIVNFFLSRRALAKLE